MDDVRFARSMVARGYMASELRQVVADAEMARIRRGAYVTPGSRTTEAQHRLLIRATLPFVSPSVVLSHGSAAVLHELPVWWSSLAHVHVTRDGQGGGRHRTNLRTHVAPLDASEVVMIDGIAVTSLARTVVDLSRTRPYDQSVAAADHALRRGLSRHDLEVASARAKGWPGAPRARRVGAFADGRSESPGESRSRVRIDEFGLPAPTPQFEVLDRHGVVIARSDFGWPERRTVGEFDGRTKYGRLLRPGETPEQAVFREKLREDAVRDLGWQMVRWISPDLDTFGPVAERLERAFIRGVR